MNWPFFNIFPNTNLHQLNLDWIVQVVGEFMEKYTTIDETIDTGITELNDKYTELSGLLDAWYTEHSEDIATQLVNALADLNEWYETHSNYLDQELADNIAAFHRDVELKAQQVFEDIPQDYSDLSTDVVLLKNNAKMADNIGLQYGFVPLLYEVEQGGFGGTIGTTYAETTAIQRTRFADFVPLSKFNAISLHLDDYTTFKWYVIALDDSNVIKWSSGFKDEDATIMSASLAATGATKITAMLWCYIDNTYEASKATWEHAFISYLPAINSNFSFRRTIAAGENLDDFYNAGVYYYGSSIHPTNEPFATGAILTVFKTDTTDRVIQIAYGYGADFAYAHKIAHRERTGGTWSKWRTIQQTEGLQGKTFSVLGDSYSAYEGYVPSGYAYHYPAGSVDNPSEMWWGELSASTGMVMQINNSYSGSSLSDTGLFPDRPDGASAERLSNLGIDPDYIIIMMGVNDFNQDAHVGDYAIGDTFPNDINSFRNALAVALKTIQVNHPTAEIILCTVPECYPLRLAENATSNPFWTNTNTGSIENLNKAIFEIGQGFGVKIADLRTIFTPANRSSWTHDGGTYGELGYTFGVHPNHGGMLKIADIIEKTILK